ncbi:MAG: hypothetical protein ABSD58_11310 [Verrucomicrobiia bacterium]|jgi:hypothetical protein
MRKFFAVVLAAWTTAGIAQVPSGQFNYAFTNTPLVDISGSLTNNTVTNVFVLTVQAASNGKLTGTVTDVYSNDNVYFDGGGDVTGSTSQKGGNLVFPIVLSATYYGVDDGVSFVENETFRGNCTITLSPPIFALAGIKRDCIVGGSCETTPEDAGLLLPDDVTGDWTLETDISAEGKKLSGTGTLTLSNGRTFTYQITGSYNTRSQVAKLKLVGEGDATGTSLSLTTEGTGMELTALKGKVLGQTPTFP